MKYLILILILALSIGCASKSNTVEVITQQTSEINPPFNNQGEQEDYWAQELFKKEYQKQTHKKYTGKIEMLNDNKFQFENIVLEIYNYDLKNQSIFINGLFYPELISNSDFSISDLEELKFLSKSPKVKRYRMWVYFPEMANPQVYFFELSNDKATDKTNLTDFIKKSKLTFIKDGWVIM